MEYKYNAIVLSKIDIAETDRIYTAYTKEAGKMRLVARGVRKPNAKLAGNLEPLSYTEIFLARGRGNGKITGAISAEGFLSLKGDIEVIQKVFFALKIFDQLLSQEEKDEKIFELLLGYLRSMNDLATGDNIKTDILTYGFIFKLLFLLGYGLEMSRCVICAGKLNSGDNFFDSERGGTVCGACAPHIGRRIKITDETIKFIRIFLGNRIENFAKIKTEEAKLNNLKLVANEATRWIVG